LAENAVCNPGVADWHGREAIRKNLKAFIDTGFTAHHDVVEYWDGGPLKVFRGIVTMRPDDPSKSTVKVAKLAAIPEFVQAFQQVFGHPVN
jgi:hypothetical protein